MLPLDSILYKYSTPHICSEENEACNTADLLGIRPPTMHHTPPN